MVNGDLDMIHDLTPEGMFTLAKQCDTCRGWFPGFPYAHPDPTLPMVIFNNQNEMFQDKRVRWALALMLDPVEMSMASYRGAATLSAIAMPPTGTHPDDYFAPMQDWLKNYELDTGDGKTIKPYDPTVGDQIANMVQPAVRRRRADRRGCHPQGLRLRLVEEGSGGRRPTADSRPASPSRAISG